MSPEARRTSPADRTGSGAVDSLWDRMHTEERSERLAHVVQDTVQDARLADALANADDSRV